MSVIATTGMTLFSALLSAGRKDKFIEPFVLNKALYRSGEKSEATHKAGHLIHYAIGFIFSWVYWLVWSRFRPSVANSSLMGFINGLGGISGWYLLFMVFHRPRLHLKKYFAQLLAAHVVFAWLNRLVYQLVVRSK